MSLVGGPNILSSMAGVMENNLGGSSTGANSTPSLSPDLPAASSSSDSCPSPMSHSPQENMLPFGNSVSNVNNNQLAQSPQRHDKHQSRSHSPTNSTTSSMSSKSSHLPGTPKRHDQFGQQQLDTTITHASVNAAAASPNSKAGNEDSNSGSNNNDDAGNTSSDDYSDEIKVYNEEGAAEEEKRNSDDLKEEKTEIIQKTIEEKPSPSHPFSINNLFGFGAAAAAASKTNASSSPFGNNPFAAAAAFGALNQQRNSLFNPAALYSQELASHFASWWPAAAAGANAFNPYSSPAFNPFNPFSAAANYQQQAAAAAVFQAAAASRFSPSLFLPPPSGSNGLASPKAEPSSHSASSSASSTSSNGSSSSSSSSAFSSSNNNSNPNMHPSSPFSGSSGSSSNSSRFNSQHHNPSNGQHNHQHHISSPSTQNFNKSHASSSAKKAKNQNYENNYPMGNNGHHMANHMGHQNHHQGNPLHPNHYIKQESQNHYIKQEGHLAAPVPHVMVKEKPKKPHVKKPLNAFMLFMKEQRAAVVSECTLRESAAINQILGRKWHELERTEQAKYYEKARLARLEHMQQNPGWSARDNYGLKKKRRRKREKVIGENGELPRKCRARYGLHQLHLWCKPCRRKKKCIRFAGDGQEMGPNGQMMAGPGGQFNAGHMGDGSAGSMNGSGGNSDDDYENYEDDSDETETDTDDENDESGYQQSPKPNKQPHLMNSNSGMGHLAGPPGFNLPPNHPGNLMQNPYQHHQPGQQYQQQMHNSFNSHLLKQMSNQMGRMPGNADMDAKAMLHHQLKLNQEPF